MEEIDWVSGASAGDAAAAAATAGFLGAGGYAFRLAVQAGATIGRAALIGVAAGTGVGLAVFVLSTAAFIAAEYVASRALSNNS
ncbi:MAG: hypothetical protein D6694_09580 [Gammaproteobacteria bacterium]|nr:MAG: hypothetical protein D6694_09580 [Gammaproteobacteria bacterium]